MKVSKSTLKKVLAMGLCASAITGILAGCGAEGGNEPATSGNTDSSSASTATVKTMTFGDSQAPTSLDVADGWSSWYTSRYGITETLFTLDENLSAQPFLCEKAEAKDDHTWVLTLRDGVTFQNGEKMTAQSVIDCWTRTMKINARLNELLYIDKMEADGQTLTVTTAKPVPAFTSSLCEPVAGIYYVTENMDPATNVTDLIGTGPYKAVSYDVKKKCVVERYDDYWQGTPALEGATFNIIADTSALAMAQQNGESDVSLTIPSTGLSTFENDSNFVVDGQTGSRGQVIWFNFENEQLQDKAVRQAISMAIDKETYASILNKGASTPATALFPDSTPYGGSTVTGYSYDLEGAKKILEDAGYTDSDGNGYLDKDGKDLSFTISTYTTKAELPLFAQAMADSLKSIGIELKIEAGAYDAVVEKQGNGKFDLMMISMTMCPTGDPQYFSDLALKSNGSANYGGYSNQEVDKLIDQLDQEFDSDKRNELAVEIQQKVMDDAGYIVIGHAKFTNVLKKNVQNCPTNPSEYYELNYQTTMTE